MNETAFETIASAASVLKLDFSSEEFAGFAEDNGLSEAAIEAVKTVFSYLREKKQQTTVPLLTSFFLCQRYSISTSPMYSWMRRQNLWQLTGRRS